MVVGGGAAVAEEAHAQGLADQVLGLLQGDLGVVLLLSDGPATLSFINL